MGHFEKSGILDFKCLKTELSANDVKIRKYSNQTELQCADVITMFIKLKLLTICSLIPTK